MSLYRKPVFGALDIESESCGCCFFFTNSGEGVFIYNGEGGTRPPDGSEPGVANVSDNGASVTPLCGTGLPATQPITFGVPVGVTGVNASVGRGGVTSDVNADGLGVSLLGIQVIGGSAGGG